MRSLGSFVGSSSVSPWETLRALVCQLDAQGIQRVKDLFWDTADKTPGGADEFKRHAAKWCAAIDMLPEMGSYSDITAEVTCDIVKRALSEVNEKAAR